MIMQAIKQTEGKFELHSANKLYIQEEFPVLENFTEKIREVYDGEVESINFLETDTTASVILALIIINPLKVPGSFSGIESFSF